MVNYMTFAEIKLLMLYYPWRKKATIGHSIRVTGLLAKDLPIRISGGASTPQVEIPFQPACGKLASLTMPMAQKTARKCSFTSAAALQCWMTKNAISSALSPARWESFRIIKLLFQGWKIFWGYFINQ
jgi:hypothetical protein